MGRMQGQQSSAGKGGLRRPGHAGIHLFPAVSPRSRSPEMLHDQRVRWEGGGQLLELLELGFDHAED